MITKILSLLSSLVAGASLMLGQAISPGTPVVAELESVPEGIDQAASAPADPNGRFKRRAWAFQGDALVRQGLVLAAVSVTGESPVMVFEALEAEKSITEIVEQAGSSEAEVLVVYDETITFLFEHRGEKRDLPESLVEVRIEWYQDVGRQMVDQPGLTPAYPGLHQLHVGIIMATARVSGAERGEIRRALKNCQTLEDVLDVNGHSGEEAVDLAVEHIDRLLQRFEDQGELSPDQHQDWLAGITDALEKMVATPGLHLAGRECAE